MDFSRAAVLQPRASGEEEEEENREHAPPKRTSPCTDLRRAHQARPAPADDTDPAGTAARQTHGDTRNPGTTPQTDTSPPQQVLAECLGGIMKTGKRSFIGRFGM